MDIMRDFDARQHYALLRDVALQNLDQPRYIMNSLPFILSHWKKSSEL